MFSLIRVRSTLCCAMAVALISSCSDPPEMLEYQKDTEHLKSVVRDARQDVTRAGDEMRDLQREKRAWEKNTELDELRAELDELRKKRDDAAGKLAQTQEEFETMKKTRLP